MFFIVPTISTGMVAFLSFAFRIFFLGFSQFVFLHFINHLSIHLARQARGQIQEVFLCQPSQRLFACRFAYFLLSRLNGLDIFINLLYISG